MPVRVRLLGDFREKAGAREVEVEARNLWELLEKLTERYEGLRNLFFGERLGENVHLLVNGTPILETGEMELRETPLKEGDMVVIFPPVAGG